MAKISISPFTIDLLARQANTYRAGKEAAYQANAEREAADARQQAYFDFAKAQQEAAWGRDDFTRERDIEEQNAGYGAAYGGYLGGQGGGGVGQVPELSMPSAPQVDPSFDYQPSMPSSPMGGRVPQLTAPAPEQPQLNYDLGGVAPPPAQGVPQITAPPDDTIVDRALAERAQSQAQQAPSVGTAPQISTQGLFGSPEGLEGGALNAYYNTVAPTISSLIAREAEHNQVLGWTKPQSDAFARGRTYIVEALPDLDSMGDEEYNQAISKLPEIAASLGIPEANINDFVDGALNMTNDIGFRPGGRMTEEDRGRQSLAQDIDYYIGIDSALEYYKAKGWTPQEVVDKYGGAFTLEQVQQAYTHAPRPVVRSSGGSGRGGSPTTSAAPASSGGVSQGIENLFKQYPQMSDYLKPQEFFGVVMELVEGGNPQLGDIPPDLQEVLYGFASEVQSAIVPDEAAG